MKNILICVDGSSYSMEACHYACWLAKNRDLSIEILYVTDLRQFEVPAVADLSGSLGVQPYDGMLAQLHEMERLKSEFIWEQARGIFEAAGLSEQTTYHHETGLLVDLISNYEGRADLIVLGKRGENANFAKKHMGSMLERVVRATETPCLVTNRVYKPMRRLAIAFDGGESTRKALAFIGAQQPFQSLELHLLVVSNPLHESRAAGDLSEAEAILKDLGLQSICQLLTGEVEDAIAGYVEDAEIDLLVVGAYGHSRIREFLIGSTTTELLRSCHVPVLCFR
jgi:nucleotide-binding universal stress UspA family protein